MRRRGISSTSIRSSQLSVDFDAGLWDNRVNMEEDLEARNERS